MLSLRAFSHRLSQEQRHVGETFFFHGVPVSSVPPQPRNPPFLNGSGPYHLIIQVNKEPFTGDGPVTSVKVVYRRVNTSSWQTVDGGWQCLVVYVCAHACARTVCVRNRELCLHPAATRQSSKVNSLFLACAQFMMCFPLHIELKPVDRNSYLMSSTFFSGGIFFFVVF